MNTAEETSKPNMDSRAMLSMVMANWPRIVAAGIVAGALATTTNLLRADTYEATAYVTVAEPGLLFQPDPRVSAQFRVPSTSSLSGFAQSDGVLEQVLDKLDQEDPYIAKLSAADLRSMGTVRASDTLLLLTAIAQTPDDAAAIANTWSGVLVGRINDLYSPAAAGELDFQRLVDSAFLRWQTTEDAATEYRNNNPQTAFAHRLTGLGRVLVGYLEAEQSLSLVQQDIRILQEELQSGDLESPAKAGDEMRVQTLTSRSLSTTLFPAGQISTTDTGRLASQEDQNPQVLATIGDLTTTLDVLSVSLARQREELSEKISAIESEITDLEETLNGNTAMLAQLDVERSIAQEFYLSLARSAQAEDADLQLLQSVARIASSASIPANSAGPSPILVGMIGAGFGIFLGVAWVLIKGWWLASNGAQ